MRKKVIVLALGAWLFALSVSAYAQQQAKVASQQVECRGHFPHCLAANQQGTELSERIHKQHDKQCSDGYPGPV